MSSDRDYECIGYSEIDKYATAIYRYHYPEHRNFGDATAIHTSELPDFDLLVTGFPCQSFSIAGKRKGFNDTRGTLFFEIARILRDKRPGYFLLENVKGLLSHDEGQTFSTILGVLSDIGYRDIQWQVLNSKDFGVPQNRERVFITGHLGNRGGWKVFPIGESNDIPEESGRQRKTEDQLATCITENLKRGVHSGGETLIQVNQNVGDAQRVFNPDGLACSLKALGGGQGAKTGLYAVLTPDRIEKRQHGRRFKENGEPSFTLTGQDIHGISDGHSIRRLTPIECERLQSFPENWTKYGIDETGKQIEISDTQRYKCLGNAVSTSVITAIIEKMYKGKIDEI